MEDGGLSKRISYREISYYKIIIQEQWENQEQDRRQLSRGTHHIS
jgi:hypothetical protein